MNSKIIKRRSSNFTPKEVKTLLALIKKYRGYIECRKTDSRTNEMKNLAWEKITREFNGILSDGIYRSVNTLRQKYENTKKQSNRKFALLMQMYKNGVDGKSVEGLNITDIDKDVKKLISNTGSNSIKVEVTSNNEETENICKQDDASHIPSDEKLLNEDIIEISEDSSFLVMNAIGDPELMNHEEISASMNDNSIFIDKETYKATPSVQNDNSSSNAPISENVDTLLELKQSLSDIQKKCFLEEHYLKMKHMKEMHRLMIQHQELQNRLSIKQQEEIHNEKLRKIKEEHIMKMKILETQRIASL
ncbi:hypothetical protein ILUMI_20633 [Ignelater luminosus]|uniref:Regulatory protein zeste n=1 Tax=Ignelater luminosus TaxID=2038154 RepID=A0A8K0CKJ0_IGNLU|nr:hypothetical protein ILUMI_20633 [Ignelater luminosus]